MPRNRQLSVDLKSIQALQKNKDIPCSHILILKALYDKDIGLYTTLIKYFLLNKGREEVTPVAVEERVKIYIKHLEELGYIKVTSWEDSDGNVAYEPLSRLTDLFRSSVDNVEDWIDKWRELFPKGSNASKYRYRGDKQGCISKMKKFRKKHPKIRVEDIFIATEKYVDKNRYNPYMRLAHYFIEKDGVSTLAAEIEALSEDDRDNYTFTERL